MLYASGSTWLGDYQISPTRGMYIFPEKKILKEKNEENIKRGCASPISL